MKTITTREFFHSPGLTKSLHPGQSLVVTDKGKASLLVTKAGKRPRRTRANLEALARKVSSRAKPQVDLTAAVVALRGR
jgi:hypothetical protein